MNLPPDKKMGSWGLLAWLELDCGPDLITIRRYIITLGPKKAASKGQSQKLGPGLFSLSFQLKLWTDWDSDWVLGKDEDSGSMVEECKTGYQCRQEKLQALHEDLTVVGRHKIQAIVIVTHKRQVVAIGELSRERSTQ